MEAARTFFQIPGLPGTVELIAGPLPIDPSELFLPIHRRDPDWREVTFEYRPATAPNEKDDHYWSCRRGYQLTRGDANRGVTDTDIVNIKRQMIQELSGESDGVMNDRDWNYTMSFRVDMACGHPVLWCWLG